MFYSVTMRICNCITRESGWSFCGKDGLILQQILVHSAVFAMMKYLSVSLLLQKPQLLQLSCTFHKLQGKNSLSGHMLYLFPPFNTCVHVYTVMLKKLTMVYPTEEHFFPIEVQCQSHIILEGLKIACKGITCDLTSPSSFHSITGQAIV